MRVTRSAPSEPDATAAPMPSPRPPLIESPTASGGPDRRGPSAAVPAPNSAVNAFQPRSSTVVEPPPSPARSIRAAFHNIYGPGLEKRWFFNPTEAGGGALTDLGVHLIDLGLWLTRPASVDLAAAELSVEQPVEHSAELQLRLDGVPFRVAVSWNAAMPATQIFFEVQMADALLRWENVDGSFFHFRTLRDNAVLLDRETSLREDTLRAFANSLATRQPPLVDPRVYAMLDQAYGR